MSGGAGQPRGMRKSALAVIAIPGLSVCVRGEGEGGEYLPHAFLEGDIRHEVIEGLVACQIRSEDLLELLRLLRPLLQLLHLLPDLHTHLHIPPSPRPTAPSPPIRPSPAPTEVFLSAGGTILPCSRGSDGSGGWKGLAWSGAWGEGWSSRIIGLLARALTSSMRAPKPAISSSSRLLHRACRHGHGVESLIRGAELMEGSVRGAEEGMNGGA